VIQSPENAMSTLSVAPAELRQLLESGESLNLIDVRTPAEFSRLHAAGAKSIPLDQLDPAGLQATRSKPQTRIYLICQSGSRASKASQQLQQAGVQDSCIVEGGTVAWERAGLPVVRGVSKVISLERQVRIGAGALVLIGTVLAWMVHPAFLVIPAFIGAGLVFSGVTDFCGMAMLLAKMPWNR
jgi:rhodanese-related sulfurtransferase